MLRTDAIGAFVCGMLATGRAGWPFPGNDGEAAAACLDFAMYHGVAQLLREAGRREPEIWSAWPESLRLGLDDAFHAGSALEMLRERELLELLDAFVARQIRVLLLKGAGLGYSVYESPALRPRTDTDLLIPPADRLAAQRLLDAAGYRPVNQVDGEYVSSQSVFIKPGSGANHAVDLHWRLSNAQVFARQFEFEQLWQDARIVARLGNQARRLSTVDALLHACLHRAVHARFGEQDRLQWLFDMHLLAKDLAPPEWRCFTVRAAEKAMAGVCLDALLACVDRLGTCLPDAAVRSLRDAAMHPELSAALLHGGAMTSNLVDLQALPDWRTRIRFLREQLLPDPGYMRATYGVDGRMPLARAYVGRLFRGAGRLVTRSSRH